MSTVGRQTRSACGSPGAACGCICDGASIGRRVTSERVGSVSFLGSGIFCQNGSSAQMILRIRAVRANTSTFVTAIYPTPPSSSPPSFATGPPLASPSLAAAIRSPPTAVYDSQLRSLSPVASRRKTRSSSCSGYCPADPAMGSARTKMQTSNLPNVAATARLPRWALRRACCHQQWAAAASFAPASTPAARADARRLHPAKTWRRRR